MTAPAERHPGRKPAETASDYCHTLTQRLWSTPDLGDCRLGLAQGPLYHRDEKNPYLVRKGDCRPAQEHVILVLLDAVEYATASMAHSAKLKAEPPAY